MPYAVSGGARIWYTKQGTGFPVLALAPGGMHSSVPLWEMAAISPLTSYAGQYQMIAMDQRNAGRSAGPLEAGNPWGAYAVADAWDGFDDVGVTEFAADPPDRDLHRLAEGVGVLVPGLFEEVFGAEGGTAPRRRTP